jgi:hypothetical protein
MKSRFISNRIIDFNKKYSIGQKIIYYPYIKQVGCNLAIRTVTKSPAGFCKKNNLAKIFIEAEKECISLHIIKPVPEDQLNQEWVSNHIWLTEKEGKHCW